MDALEPEDRVLICLVSQPRDLEIARWDHWFRLPGKHAPPELPDVLAFYLAASFEDECHAVHEYARVRGHELLRRADLFPDQAAHPRADLPYYKFQLGPLHRLPRPIPSLSWRRFVAFQSTGDRLLRALDLRELVEDHSRRFLRLMDAQDDGEFGSL